MQELNMIIRDQVSILNSLNDEDEALERDLAEIEQKIRELEAIKRTNPKEIILDPNFVTRCLNTVVFADDASKAALIQIARSLMMQGLVKRPNGFVSISMQYDFISAWQICLNQHLKVLKQMKLTANLTIIDSMTNIADLVKKVLSPVDAMQQDSYVDNATRFRNNRLFGRGG